MRKVFIAGAAVSLCFIPISYVRAQSVSELQAELNALLAQLSALQAELQSQRPAVGVPTVPSYSSYGQCPSLGRSLRRGMSGSDVGALQTFLAPDVRIYPEGIISGYFGTLTEAAVQRFQARHAIVNSGTPDTTGYGAVGPATRSVIARVCAGGVNGVPTTPVPIPTPIIPQAQCTIAGMTLASGATVQMYSQPQAPVGASCASYTQTRQCVNGTMSGNPIYQYTTCNDTIGQACFVNGTLVPHGSSRTFFTQSSVPFGSTCSSISQSRACNNGSISGSTIYQYASCTPNEANQCAVGDTTVNHGSSKTFYIKSLVAFGESCSTTANSQSRACTNGAMSGSSAFDKPTCTSATSPSCILDGKTVANNSSGDFYNTRTVPFMSGTTCPAANKLSRRCTNGIFDGDSSFQYATCSIGPASSCSFDGQTVPHNSTYKFYSAVSVPFGTTNGCNSISQVRTCTNGVLNGSDTYNRAVCIPAAASSCMSEDGVPYAHGVVASLSNTSSVPFGSTCARVNRTCQNGTFSGTQTTYKYANCSIGNANSCTTLDNFVIPHGSSSPMYTTSSVPFGSTCSKVTRTCSNGSLGTNATYGYKVCTIGSALSPTCALQTDKSIYLPNQGVNLSWTSQNAQNGFLTYSGTTLGASITGPALTSGSRANAISFSMAGDRVVTLNLNGNSGTTGQCTANVRVQDVLPPTCTLTVKKQGATTAGSSVTLNYADNAVITWTSTNAADYASSTPSATSATTSIGVASGSLTLRPRDRSYTYTFNNAGGSTSCTVNVNYNPPTCTLTSDKTTYLYGDQATLSWTNPNGNADYVTATSSDRLATSGSVTYKNFIADSTFTFTFTGLGGQQSCSRTIDVGTTMTVSGPSDNDYQPGNEIAISWNYPTTASANVYLMLVDMNGNKIGTANIVAGLQKSSGYSWVIPTSVGGHTLTTGGYAIRAVAYTPSTACTSTNTTCSGVTVLARMDSNIFTISVPTLGSLSARQLAAALAALESLLQSMLAQLDSLF